MPAQSARRTHVIISPHFDDGIFSCGGTAHQFCAAGDAVIVMTIMGGLYDGELPDTPILADLHRRWQAGENPLRQRQIEDERASHAIGVDFMHVPLPDCVYRVAGDLALYPSEESLFANVHPSDYAPRLLQGIQIPELETAATVYLPLGVGHHVDHQIARDWGMTQVRDIPDKSALRFYAEFPYSNADHSTEIALADFGMPLQPADSPLREEDIRAKIKAIACYCSQISTFWDGLEAMEADVRRAFTDADSGQFVERLWKIAST
ncbi:MAG: PIG-L family deacetylase [Chloroflexi bacterium]|nr:PIG-L family deacetylase [Chloroflexota bacterium]